MRVLVWCLIAGCGGHPAPVAQPIAHEAPLVTPTPCPASPAAAPTYQTATVARGTVTSTVALTASLAPLTLVSVGNLNAGHITEISVDANTMVKKGDVLARLDTRNERIIAPLDGIVLERRVEVGQVATSGATLFTVATSPTLLKLEAQVGEADVSRLKPAGKADFTVDAFPDRRFVGVVRSIGNVATPGVHGSTYKVTIDVDNRTGILRFGMTAALAVEVDTHADVLVIPTAALAFRPSNDGRPTVWVLAGGALKPVAVDPRLSDPHDHVTEIAPGELHEGDLVVLAQH